MAAIQLILSVLNSPLSSLGFLVSPALLTVAWAEVAAEAPRAASSPEPKQTMPPQPAGELSAPTPSTGEISAPTQSAPPAPATGSPETETTFIDVIHSGLSRGLLSTATYLDSFFGDQRYESELNQSHVRFRYNVFLEEDTGPVHKADQEVRIVLPQLREKTHLVISGTPKEDNQFSAINTNSTTDQLTTGDSNVTTALHYQVRETASQNFIVRAGLKLHKRKPAITLGPRYRVLIPLDHWTLRLVEDVVWRSDLGWLAKSTIDLERPLPRDFFFRASTEWVRTEHTKGYSYVVGANLRQPLSPRRALEYEWVNVFVTSPIHELAEVDLRIRYRQRIWRDWLYYELTPQYRYPRDRGFKATPGILFRLDMMFGHLE